MAKKHDVATLDELAITLPRFQSFEVSFELLLLENHFGALVLHP